MNEDTTMQLLKESGHRLTPQRLMVLSAIRGAKDHVTATEILEQVKETYPYIDMSTVYRTLGVLREMRLVSETDLGDGELAELVAVGEQCVAQLTQAASAEGVIARPVGGVEGGARRRDGGIHVGRGGVGRLPDDLLGRGIDDVEDATAPGGELAVDQQIRRGFGAKRHELELHLDRCLDSRSNLV